MPEFVFSVLYTLTRVARLYHAEVMPRQRPSTLVKSAYQFLFSARYQAEAGVES